MIRHQPRSTRTYTLFPYTTLFRSLLSCFGLGVDFLFMAYAPTLIWLFVGRVVSGITASRFSMASAYIADVTAPEKRAAAYGMLGAAFCIGFIFGPALGGVLGHNDPRLPLMIAGALAGLHALYQSEERPVGEACVSPWKFR